MGGLDDVVERARRLAPDDLLRAVEDVAEAEGIKSVRLFVADYEHAGLHPVGVGSRAVDASVPLDIDRTLAGRCFTHGEVIETNDPAPGVWVPVCERDDRLGVLHVETDERGVEGLEVCRRLGLLVGQLLRTTSQYTDVFELRRRRNSMNLAAELQWELLPPLSFGGRGVQIDGLLEPAYEIGGDVFDYALNGSTAYFAVFDAMGHGLEAAQSAALVLSTFRYCRRRRLPLIEMAMTIDVALGHLYNGDRFATGVLAELDTTTGRIRWLNAGHPDPLLVRAGRVVGEPTTEHCPPFGLGIQVAELGELVLSPGDRLLLFSDGVVEARSQGGDQFGRDGLLAAVEAELQAERPPPAVLRRIVRAVLSHRAGELEDDVTLVLVGFEPDGAVPGEL